MGGWGDEGMGGGRGAGGAGRGEARREELRRLCAATCIQGLTSGKCHRLLPTACKDCGTHLPAHNTNADRESHAGSGEMPWRRPAAAPHEAQGALACNGREQASPQDPTPVHALARSPRLARPHRTPVTHCGFSGIVSAHLIGNTQARHNPRSRPRRLATCRMLGVGGGWAQAHMTPFSTSHDDSTAFPSLYSSDTADAATTRSHFAYRVHAGGSCANAEPMALWTQQAGEACRQEGKREEGRRAA